MRLIAGITLLVPILLASAAAQEADVGIGRDAEATFLAISVFGNSTSAIGPAVSVFGNATGWGAATIWGDARGRTSSTSVFGDAEGGDAVSVFGNVTQCIGHCLGITVFGDAYGDGISVLGTCGSWHTEPPIRCLAVATDGDATGHRLAVSPVGNASCVWTLCLAVGGKDASGWVAVAATGNASGDSAFAAAGHAEASRDVAVSLLGPADACPDAPGSCLLALSVLGPASSSYAAASGTGDARGSVHGATATGDAEGRRAVSVTGDAESTCGEAGCFAVSGTGHASGPTAVSGCDTLAASGRPEACSDWWRPQVDELLP